MLLPSIFLIVLFFFLGASIASFLCVVAERSSRGETIQGTSHCACGRPLKRSENIPVIGYLRTGGVAKCCGAVLPRHYVYSEVFLGVVFAVALGYSLSLYTLTSLIIAALISVAASFALLAYLKKLVSRSK